MIQIVVGKTPARSLPGDVNDSERRKHRTYITEALATVHTLASASPAAGHAHVETMLGYAQVVDARRELKLRYG